MLSIFAAPAVQDLSKLSAGSAESYYLSSCCNHAGNECPRLPAETQILGGLWGTPCWHPLGCTLGRNTHRDSNSILILPSRAKATAAAEDQTTRCKGPTVKALLCSGCIASLAGQQGLHLSNSCQDVVLLVACCVVAKLLLRWLLLLLLLLASALATWH